MPGFGGFAGVEQGYDQGAESYWKRRQLENQPAIDAATIRGLQALQGGGMQQGGPMASPGGQPPMGMPQQAPMPGAQPMPGGGPMSGGGQPQAPPMTQPRDLVGLKPDSQFATPNFSTRFDAGMYDIGRMSSGGQTPPAAQPASYGGGPPPGFINPSQAGGQPQNLTGPVIPPGGFGGGPQAVTPQPQGQPPGGFNGGPPPQQGQPQQRPSPQGGANLGMELGGFLSRNPIAAAIIRANPGAPPEVLMGAITKAMPLMQNDAIQQWRQLQTQMQYDKMGNQRDIAAGHDDAATYRANLAAELKRDAQIGLGERAELSSNTRLALGGLSASTKLEIAGRMEAGRDKRAELSAETKKELAGMNTAARKELQEFLEGKKDERQERGIAAKSAETTARSESAMDRLRTGLQAKGEQIVLKGEVDREKQLRGQEFTGQQNANKAAWTRDRQEQDQEFKRQLDASRQAQINERLKFATAAKSDILKQTLTERADLQKERLAKADDRTDKVVNERYDRTNKVIAAAQERINQRRGSPEDIKLVAQSIAEYRQAPANGNPLLMAEVQRINPQYNAANWAPMQRMLSAFAAGPEGRTARSLYVADHHIGRLIQVAAGLNNSDSTTWSWAMNALAREFNTAGQPRTFEAVKQFIASEIVKAGAGVSGGGQTERMHLMNNIDTNSSLESIMSSAQALQKLLKDQQGGLKRQYENQPGAPKDFERRFGFEPTDLELQKNTGVQAAAAKKTDSVMDKIGYRPQWYEDAKKRQGYSGPDDASIPSNAKPRSYQGKEPFVPRRGNEAGGRVGAGGTSGKQTVAPDYGAKKAEGETIVGAAYKVGNEVYQAPIHAMAKEKAMKALGVTKESELIERQAGSTWYERHTAHEMNSQGFLTSTGRFVSRKEAEQLAKSQKQLKSGAGGRLGGINAEDLRYGGTE